MKNRIRVSMEGTAAYRRNNQDYYLAYVPLHINYWYLIVSTQAESIDSTALYRQQYMISGVLVAVIIIRGLFFLLYLMIRNRMMKDQNFKLQMATEQANQAKRDFPAKISHEIRTPLNGVMGMIELARKNYKDKEKCLDEINKAAVSADYLRLKQI